VRFDFPNGWLSAGERGVEVWVFRDGRKPIAVIEPDAAAPAPGKALRAEGLWLSITEESAGHWSVSLEAFGLELDDPDDVFGIPTPIGLDLEWEDDPDPSSCRVTGEVLVAEDVVSIDGRGARSA
jgi:hypothetical protein